MVSTVVWMVIVLAAFDIGVNLVFPYPSDPAQTEVSTTIRYFDYGRSIEGKFLRQIGPTDETSSSLAQAGWLADLSAKDGQARLGPGHTLISFYGMSFAGNVAEEINRIDPTIDLRLLLGPATPPNHTYEVYLRDQGKQRSDVLVFGILASSVAAMDSMSGAGLGTDFPAPYTFPLFTLEQGRLAKIEPMVQSLSELRATLGKAQRRRAYLDQLYRHDGFVTPAIFEASFLDRSALCRLVRRAYATSYQSQRRSRIHGQNGFSPGWDKIPVLEAMLVEFGKSAKAGGQLPFVILFQDKGYGDHLYRLLKAKLEANAIPFVSTHDVAPASDLSNFVDNGHFTEEANHRISLRVLEAIKSSLQLARR
jgi:hypothetical protein